MAQLLEGDCLELLPTIPDSSIDSIVTDPPYGLEFMGQEWDKSAGYQDWCLQWAVECLRILKPGGYLLAFGGTRTYHRLTCAIEDAGFEIRDSIAWLYGSGFPKSLDVSKAIDRAAGADRQVVGTAVYGDGHVQRSTESIGYHGCDPAVDRRTITAPATDDAARWQGWGTALKPAHEPIVVARKPLIGTVAKNVQEYGTGAINVDGCRIGNEARINPAAGNKPGGASLNMSAYGMPENVEGKATTGRWPANVVLSHAPTCADTCVPGCPVAELDQQSGMTVSRAGVRRNHNQGHEGWSSGTFRSGDLMSSHADSGGASRFFPVFRYQAKAPPKERSSAGGVKHPTVKPLELMRWLVRLVTPPDGVVLDPFAGSGTTVEAAILEGMRWIAIEKETKYMPLVNERVARAQAA